MVCDRFKFQKWSTQRITFFWRYTGEEIISISNDLFNKNNVLWENSIKATTDRVDASGAIHKGLQVRVIEITPNMNFTQRWAVEAKKRSQEVHKMMQDVIDVACIIKIRPLISSKILLVFCNEHIEI